ncbi:MAG: hypothetical protein LBP58_01195 [Azoarcus sp.]|jgi:hypothetical protein|nr:hypothetical protein [Azoarcus sp.]
MAFTKNTPIIWQGAGPVQIGTFDLDRGRADQGYIVDVYRVGCGTSALTTSISIETRDVKETCSGHGCTLIQYTNARTLTVSLSLVQFSGRTLAAALFGAAVENEGGTVTDEILPELAPGDYFNLRHVKASDIVIADSTGSPIQYVEGTHYEVEDAGHGRIHLIGHPQSHVEPVMVDYAYGRSVNIKAFSQTNVERGIIFDGLNQSGQRARLIIPRVALSLNGDFSWISNEEATLTLSGNALYVQQLEGDTDYNGFARVSLFSED